MEAWEERIDDNCIILHHPTSANVLFVFAAVDIPPGQIPGGTRLFRTDLIDANIVILNDPQKTWYLGGIKGFGEDLDHTLKRIQEIHTSLLGLGGVTMAYGNSMGAFGAVYYGCLLNWDVVLAPGCELLVGNPIGYAFPRIRGRYKRPNLREIVLHSRTFCHILVGEEFLADAIGSFKIQDLPNIYVQSVKNFNHGVAAYLATHFNVRKIINNYISIFSKKDFAESFRCDFKNIKNCERISNHYFPQAIVEPKDCGTLLKNKNTALYLYSTDIMLKLNTPNYNRRIKKLTELANQERDATIKSYTLFRIAKIYSAIKKVDISIETAIASYKLNESSCSIPQFISTLYFKKKLWEECCFWSQEAIANRKGKNLANIFAPSDCYMELCESLINLGLYKLSLIHAEEYIKIRNMVRVEDLKNLIVLCRERLSQSTN